MRLDIKKEPDHGEPSGQGKECGFTLKCNTKLVKGLKWDAGAGW